MKRAAIVLTAVCAFVLALGAVALAQEEEQFLGGKLRMGDGITVPAGETVDGDLYIFGGDVNVDGVVLGDLVVFGGTVTVDGAVEGDLMVGSGTLTLNGTVSGDMRVGAGQVTARGDVGEDLLAGVGQLDVTGDVGGDLVFGAGIVGIGGDIAGDVLGQTGSYTLSGTVQGTEDVTVREPREVERPNVFLQALYRFASLLIIGLLILGIRRSTFQRTVAAITERPGPVALWGFGFLFGLVVVPGVVTLVGILLAIVFGWLGLGLIVGLIVVMVALTWVLTAAIGFILIAVLAPLTTGTWLAARFLPDRTAGYLEMAAGIAVLVVLGLIPVVRVLVGLAVTVMGAGAWLHLMQRSSKTKVAAVEP